MARNFLLPHHWMRYSTQQYVVKSKKIFLEYLITVHVILTNFSPILVASGIYQNTVYGLAAKLPFKYTGAVVLGSVSILINQRNVSILMNFYLSESEWYHSQYHQHHFLGIVTQPKNCCYILFHHSVIHTAGLF